MSGETCVHGNYGPECVSCALGDLATIKSVLEWASTNVLSVWHHGYGEWQIQGKGFNLFMPTLYQALHTAWEKRDE